MNAVRIKKRLDSDTIHLPELHSMIGKEVEIIILAEQPASLPKQDLSALHQIAGNIDLDFDAIQNLRGQGDFSLLEELAGKDVVEPDALEQLRKASMI